MKNLPGSVYKSLRKKEIITGLSKIPVVPVILLVLVFVMSGCADVQPNIEPHLVGHKYGFWGGLWHGMIAPFAFIGSLFDDTVAVWAINNNGGWYTLGFILGVGVLGGSSSKAAGKRKKSSF